MKLIAALLLLLPGDVMAQGLDRQQRVLSVELALPTLRYDHGVLGDSREWGGLALRIETCGVCAALQPRDFVLRLPENRVFEDATARLADVDGNDGPEVVVVETDLELGASLAVYGIANGVDGGMPFGKIAATPFIGQTHRWLAPAGIGDFDGDGRNEIAYVDRPHLNKELVFVKLVAGELVEIARVPGLSNHQIGDRTIAGGVRECPDGVQVVVASADWTRAIAVGLPGSTVQITELGPISGPADLSGYMSCSG